MSSLKMVERVSASVIGRISGRKLQVTLRPDVQNADAIASRIRDLAVQTAVKKMLKGNHFSICDWDQICRVAGVIQDGELREQMQLLHCVHWMDMPAELREFVVGAMLDTLAVAGVCEGSGR